MHLCRVTQRVFQIMTRKTSFLFQQCDCVCEFLDYMLTILLNMFTVRIPRYGTYQREAKQLINV